MERGESVLGAGFFYRLEPDGNLGYRSNQSGPVPVPAGFKPAQI